MKINNVNLEKAAAFAEEVKKDKSKALKIKRVEGKTAGSGQSAFR